MKISGNLGATGVAAGTHCEFSSKKDEGNEE